jgi:hypothetical protein
MTAPPPYTPSEIFASVTAGEIVLQAVNDLRLALVANHSTAIETAMEDLHTARNHLKSELAYCGSARKTVAAAGALKRYVPEPAS